MDRSPMSDNLGDLIVPGQHSILLVDDSIPSAHNPVRGYTLAILMLIMIGAQAFFSLTMWPTLKQQENPIVFVLFWGLMLGLKDF